MDNRKIIKRSEREKLNIFGKTYVVECESDFPLFREVCFGEVESLQKLLEGKGGNNPLYNGPPIPANPELLFRVEKFIEKGLYPGPVGRKLPPVTTTLDFLLSQPEYKGTEENTVASNDNDYLGDLVEFTLFEGRLTSLRTRIQNFYSAEVKDSKEYAPFLDEIFKDPSTRLIEQGLKRFLTTHPKNQTVLNNALVTSIKDCSGKDAKEQPVYAARVQTLIKAGADVGIADDANPHLRMIKENGLNILMPYFIEQWIKNYRVLNICKEESWTDNLPGRYSWSEKETQINKLEAALEKNSTIANPSRCLTSGRLGQIYSQFSKFQAAPKPAPTQGPAPAPAPAQEPAPAPVSALRKR